MVTCDKQVGWMNTCDKQVVDELPIFMQCVLCTNACLFAYPFPTKCLISLPFSKLHCLSFFHLVINSI